MPVQAIVQRGADRAPVTRSALNDRTPLLSPVTYTSPPSGELMISVALSTTSALTSQRDARRPTHVDASNDHVRSAIRGSA